MCVNAMFTYPSSRSDGKSKRIGVFLVGKVRFFLFFRTKDDTRIAEQRVEKRVIMMEWPPKSEVTMPISGTGCPKPQLRLGCIDVFESINLGRRRGIRVMSIYGRPIASTASWLREENNGV
ncbi:uncharacterized protein TRIVIDRAFT_215638 [Trichoderma virens Gv29-8]|uniref:Uncharacterized protein n=1 Tax=Hypocrea virens (strain Gv29-8 / FGSC 10586) TaxID=413071 RepID=G9MMR6_HYPVG|nr:uncharacterized protein TRIVIDRAFT_215638 [Trichoderma virens Gv29-8]EHK24634.1 hypothetical protein TRIVIDRAFT_215638 [Trichoderma virens Gv29-8]